MSNITTPDDYKKALKCFDWYYDKSDDYSVWSRGQQRLGELMAAQKKFDPDRAIWHEVVKRLASA